MLKLKSVLLVFLVHNFVTRRSVNKQCAYAWYLFPDIITLRNLTKKAQAKIFDGLLAPICLDGLFELAQVMKKGSGTQF